MTINPGLRLLYLRCSFSVAGEVLETKHFSQRAWNVVPGVVAWSCFQNWRHLQISFINCLMQSGQSPQQTVVKRFK